jgi:hypothetical protein
MTDQELLMSIGRYLVPDQGSRQLGRNVWGKVQAADNSAVDFVNYLLGNSPTSAMGAGGVRGGGSPAGGGGGGGWGATPTYATGASAPVVNTPMVGYGEPNYANSNAGRQKLMAAGSAPTTAPIKQSNTGVDQLTASLTRPNLNLTTSTSYPGYGDRGPLTVPAGSNYVPQTAPPLVPGAYTIPGGTGRGPMTGMDGQTSSPTGVSWGPTPDYYGMQEQWTPPVTGK